MAIIQEREIARADMNDEFGVTVFQEAQQTEYSIEEARAFAAEILAAADEAERIRTDDVHASSQGYPHMLGESGEVVL